MQPKKIITLASVALISAAFVVGDVFAARYSDMITTFLCGTATSTASNETMAASDELCQKIGAEGITLLKNQNNTLPLTEKALEDGKYTQADGKAINIFGWAGTDQGFLLSGIGSGASTIQENKKVTLYDAFRNQGWKVNEYLEDFYNDYDSTDYGYTANRIKLIEPDASDYSDDLIWDCQDYSGIAMVVISRVAGENVGEVPTRQTKTQGQGQDEDRTYLELSTQEEDLIDLCVKNFDTVIVLVNSSNQMSLEKVNEPGVDAVLSCSLTGQSGTMAIPKILMGEINPSGRLTDTFAYDYKKEPSYQNHLRNGNHIVYEEDMYFGYRWYETADTEGYFENESRTGYNREGKKTILDGYDAMVQYPFGYGLSYTTFDWNLESIQVLDKNGQQTGTTLDGLNKDSHVKLSFSCQNTGSVAGADVLQLYATAPYNRGQIEKPSEILVDYAKSTTIKPGMTQTGITLEFDMYDLASYDCYDANANDFAGYELERGTYTLKLMENSHEEKKMSDDKSELKFTLNDNYEYDVDPVTGEEVKNRFTGEDAYAGVPMDGSTVYNDSANKPTYLSRADFKNTFPNTQAAQPDNTTVINQAVNYTNTSNDQTKMPTLNAKNGLSLTSGSGSNVTYNDELMQKIGSDYESEELQQLVDQVSADEACSMVEGSGFGTPAISSIGKIKNLDFDGPAGFNSTTQTGDSTGTWTAFPCEVLIGQTWSKSIAKQMGLSMGVEANETGLSGWYAPGVNMHRSPFNGRNYEYYSEDPFLNGKMAGNVITGAKANNLYCFLKHFCLSEPGVNARDLRTWLTEQNFREIYLKPFEIAVKEYGSNAIMTAFNFVGGTWAGANAAMNIDVLRGEWGFRGMIITDWSDGSGSMNTPKGLLAGNDIWLCPSAGANNSKLSRSNPTHVYCAKNAVKNVVYTICETYTFHKNYKGEDSTINTSISNISVFPWWIPVVIAVEALAFGGMGVWIFFTFRKPKEQN